MRYEIWCDRDLSKLYGRLTLQKVVGGKATKIFERLPFASGQLPYLDGGLEDWIQGKGPTPIGEHILCTKREDLFMAPVGTPFYVISSKEGKRWLRGPGDVYRYNIGLHLENQYPGTEGCTALLHNTAERSAKAWALFGYLDNLYKQGIEYIRYKVV